MFSAFFHFVRRFWNQILTCCWVTWRLVAISALSAEERYFLLSKLFSSSNICLPVNVVRIFFLLELELSSSFASVWISESFFLLFLFPTNFDWPEIFISRAKVHVLKDQPSSVKLSGFSIIFVPDFSFSVLLTAHGSLLPMPRMSVMECGVNLCRGCPVITRGSDLDNWGNEATLEISLWKRA